jgi:uncharacterized protein (TIGR03435 family)
MRHTFRSLALAGIVLAAGAAWAQTAPATPPAVALTFDVASVRPAAPIDQATIVAGLRAGHRPETVRIDAERATFTYMSLKGLVAYAYKVREYQVTGPDWMATDRFDVAANLPANASRDDVPAMLQALLAERFKLAAHLETKEQPVLGLMLAKGGSKLKESTVKAEPIDDSVPLRPGETKADSVDGPVRVMRNPDGSTTYNMGLRGNFTLKVDGQTGSMHLSSDRMTTKGLAVMMTSLAGGNGRQIVDMTGLAGVYQVAVDFSLMDLVASLRDSGIDIPIRPGSGGDDPAGGSSLSQTLAQQGLKLERSRAPIQQLIVDHVEKSATEN